MKLKGEYAVISFCHDLTDPDAVSVPVALLLIAQKADRSLAAAVGREVADVDPITAEFLRDIPRLLKDQVQSIQQARTVPDILRSLHNALRNSLHVSKISECELDVAADLPLESQFSRIIEATQNAFNDELEAAGERRLLTVPMTTPPNNKARLPAPARSVSVLSAAEIWRLHGGGKYGSGAPVD
jgi:hypothetical protein